MYSSDLVIQYNPGHLLLVCIDLAGQLGMLMMRALCMLDVCTFIHSPRITCNFTVVYFLCRF